MRFRPSFRVPHSSDRLRTGPPRAKLHRQRGEDGHRIDRPAARPSRRSSTMFDLGAIQKALGQFGLDGWLLHDFRGYNLLARRVLDLSEQGMGSRRLYYMVPARGTPQKLVHRIESAALDHLPGPARVYL